MGNTSPPFCWVGYSIKPSWLAGGSRKIKEFKDVLNYSFPRSPWFTWDPISKHSKNDLLVGCWCCMYIIPELQRQRQGVASSRPVWSSWVPDKGGLHKTLFCLFEPGSYYIALDGLEATVLIMVGLVLCLWVLGLETCATIPGPLCCF